MFRLLFVLLAMTQTTSCAASEMDGTPVPEHYAYLFEGGLFPAEVPSTRAALPFEKIQMTHSGVWYTPGSTITMWRDGRAEGSLGIGEVTLWDFGALCYLIEKLNFASMAGHYQADGTDNGTSIVKVWRSGQAEPTVVRDYGGVGPIELWGIQTAIDGVAGRIHWEEAGQPSGTTN